MDDEDKYKDIAIYTNTMEFKVVDVSKRSNFPAKVSSIEFKEALILKFLG